MRALDVKMLRDLRRLWAQSLAIAMVLACGVATLILAVGASRSLDETREAYYERYRFADVFATASRAPRQLVPTIRHIDGVLAAEARVSQGAILDIEGMPEPATGIVLSLPEAGEPALNRLYLRSGRLPDADRTGEVAVSAGFAEAHGFRIGARFRAVINGKRRDLEITAIVLSPEFVYSIGPGDMVPDNRRFAVIWMPQRALEALGDLEGAFNSVSVGLTRGADERAVIAELDRILRPYGSTGAYGRRDQMSHAFLDSELQQLRAMAKVIPPIFLFVSAFLINMILTRLISLEREQIGLLKALGYGRAVIAWHYLKLVVAISLIGIAIGIGAGMWLGNGLTRLYAEFFSFPFLLFVLQPDIYVIAATAGVAAAVAGALKAVMAAVRLPAAVAMRPPAPERYRRSLVARLGLGRYVSQLTIMAMRHLVRWPVRSALTSLGTALSVSILILALFTTGSINFMIDTIFFRTDRQHATVTFADRKGPDALEAVRRLPGVLRAEPFRAEAVRLTNGHLSRRLSIVGKTPDARLSRVLDAGLAPMTVPETGLAVSERVASLLGLRRGDLVEVAFLEQDGRTGHLPVTEIISSYIGLSVFMNIDSLDRAAGEGPRISGAYIAADAARLEELYDAVKATPALAGIALQRVSQEKFRETIEQNITIMTSVYLVLAVIIAFGVVYNSARIQLSERGRELASLRVFGFTRNEVARVLILEMSVITLAAQPLGWLLGYGFTFAVVRGFDSDLFRIPHVTEPAAFAKASLIVLAAAAASAFIVHRRVNRLDLIRVLKTRE